MTVWLRRARPLLGTLVEIGVADQGAAEAAMQAAFAAVQRVQSCMSRFEQGSDVARFAALPVGEGLVVAPETAEVLRAARALQSASGGLFDITLGCAPDGWHCDGHTLHKRAASAVFDLGGIAKGYAVDRAVQALQCLGCEAGWVNAGGDLRAFGPVQVPVLLRDEEGGGVRPFAHLGDGALATSCLGPQRRSQAWVAGSHGVSAHVSVAAPSCLWADALTKVVAASGDARHPVLQAHGARAWLH
ncbi:FAD:protein FMN transferase [Paenacidovorax monticola]|uniref:FAD:protein FMN transferase n=1 Tax=Paenacidovorax monticola TaxID=1926868 RepID=A0A7H0HB19_9BURK|nr:FAD:protein FMN transferase [Paenacidovorax monticola]QNP57735.1 FAD:protein FMN transferase [Paenacidovorax monticola]